MALFKDFKIKTSPQAVNLVSNIMDAQGLHSNTSDGINKLLSMIDKHPSAGSRGWLEKNQKGEYEESNPGINNLHYDPTYHNHPVVEEVTRKRIIDHLDNLTKPNELYLHLGKINKVLGTSYRDSTPFQKASAHSYALGEKIPEVASTHTVLPRDEQTKLLDGITRLITHPHFADGIAQHGPSYLGKRLSNKNNMIGFSQARFNNSENPVDYDHHKLFSRLITHDDLRNQLHDTLDKIETRSPAHKQLAAAIRGHMLSFSLINPKELTRLTKKFMSDTDSIDVGRYGLYGKRKNEFIGDKASDGYEYHTPEEMEQINKKNDQKTWTNTHGENKQSHNVKVLKLLSHSRENIHAYSVKDHMDHIIMFEHATRNHPNPELRTILDTQGIQMGGGHLDKTFSDYLHRMNLDNLSTKIHESDESKREEFTDPNDRYLTERERARLMTSKMYFHHKNMKQITSMM